MCQTSEETFAHQTRSPDSVTLPFSASSWLPLTPEVKIGAHMLHCVHQRVAYIVWIVCGAVSLNNNNNNKESCLLRPRTTIMRAATNTVKLWAVLKQTNERRDVIKLSRLGAIIVLVVTTCDSFHIQLKTPCHPLGLLQSVQS